MGRYVRSALQSFERIGEVQTLLIVRANDEARRLREEFAYRAIGACEVREGLCDAVWYPWNGIRFSPHAPSALTVHDLFAFSEPHRNWIARRREQSPIRRGIRTANLLTAVSGWTAQSISRRFSIDPLAITVLPPVRNPWWHPVEVKGAMPYILFVAAPEARKNAPLLFSAFDRAFAGKPVELIVAGRLSDRDRRAFAAMQAERKSVTPSDTELRVLYAGAAALAMPSCAEGLGLPALEAMACGAPVLAADAGALPETCGGAALLLPPDDPAAWQDGLARIVEDERLRRSLRQRGLQRVAQLDPDGTAKLLLASLRRSIEAGR